MKTHCPQGHEHNGENTYVDKKGYQHCRRCTREQMRRIRADIPSVGRGHVNAVKTHCPKGHEYTEENTYRNPQGRRWCRACSRLNLKIQNVKRYGITPEDVTQMLKGQNNECKICTLEFGAERVPHIDHDHTCCPSGESCGKCIRGLVCNNCNQGLGRFQDSPEILRAAADYLERFAAVN